MSELNTNISAMLKSNEINKKAELSAIKKNAQALIEMAQNIENGNASSDMLPLLVNTISGIAGRITAADARIETCKQMQEMIAC